MLHLASHTLIFDAHSSSRYSAATLLGAIEIDPRLVDVRIEAPNCISEGLVKRSLDCGPVTVAHSVMSTQIRRVFQEVRHLREGFGKSLTVVGGGPHASARPRELLDNGFDFVIVGEGEKAFPDLLNSLMLREDPLGIEGVVGTHTDSIPEPSGLSRVDLDEYPPFALKRNLVGPVEVTRGCPFSCKFCCTPFLTGGTVRHRSVEKVVDWLEQAVARSGFERTWFLSPNALSYGGRGRRVMPEKLEGLLRQTARIEGLNEIYFGSFPSEVRPEFVTKPILQMMRDYVANDTLQIGLQSSSDRILRLANRHHTVEDGVRAINIAQDCGFTPHVDMIFGLPGESQKDRHRSIDFCYTLAEMGAKTHGHVFMPLPGSAFESEKPGRLDETSRKMLGELSRRGFMTGSWIRQETIADTLVETPR